jgi:hypothetical protein
MKNREFDDALREFVKGSGLPYDPGQWERMAQRLTAYENAQKPALIPAPARRRAVPFYRWTAAAAAACLVVMAALYFDREPVATDAGHPFAHRQPPTPDKPAAYADVKQPEAEIAAPAETRPAAPANVRRAPVDIAPSPAPAPAPAAAVIAAQQAPADSTPRIARDEAIRPEKKVRYEQPLPGFPQEDDPETPAERKLAFGVNGGYNIGGAKNNFTIGVTVNRKLGSRLHLETGIALVSGTSETYQAFMVADRSQTGNLTSAAAYTTEYQAETSPLFYLQAAPTLNYRIFKGISAGGGVDAQRRLGNYAQTTTWNKLGAPGPVQPQWDFGLTARVDFRVVKKLRAGMMYRESIGAITKGAAEAARRNYLLLQLSYIIF